MRVQALAPGGAGEREHVPIGQHQEQHQAAENHQRRALRWIARWRRAEPRQQLVPEPCVPGSGAERLGTFTGGCVWFIEYKSSSDASSAPAVSVPRPQSRSCSLVASRAAPCRRVYPSDKWLPPSRKSWEICVRRRPTACRVRGKNCGRVTSQFRGAYVPGDHTWALPSRISGSQNPVKQLAGRSFAGYAVQFLRQTPRSRRHLAQPEPSAAGCSRDGESNRSAGRPQPGDCNDCVVRRRYYAQAASVRSSKSFRL